MQFHFYVYFLKGIITSSLIFLIDKPSLEMFLKLLDFESYSEFEIPQV